MAKPSSRQELIDYCKRQLGAPVLQINIDDDQVSDVIDDAIQFYQEWHYDGVERMYLKHKISPEDVERFNNKEFSYDGISPPTNNSQTLITTTAKTISTTDQTLIDSFDLNFLNSAEYSIEIIQNSLTQTTKILLTHDGTTSYITEYGTLFSGNSAFATFDAEISSGFVKLFIKLDSSDTANIKVSRTSMTVGSSTFTGGTPTTWEESTNYISIPDHVIGISKVFGVSSNWIRNDLFGLSNQYFLMDMFSFSSGFAFGNFDMTNYYMIRQYFETMDMIVNTGALVQYRFNKRQDRLYLDIDVARIQEGNYLLIDCHRALDPEKWSQVYNDSFVKRYATALMKRQWGQNLIKYNNVQLPGGITLNGRQIWEDGENEVKQLEADMALKYTLPPMDAIG